MRVTPNLAHDEPGEGEVRCPGCGAILSWIDIINYYTVDGHLTGRCPICEKTYCFSCGELLL